MRSHNDVRLTPTQHKIAELLADGFVLREIAEKLERSPNTISTHLKRMKAKLDARSSVQVAVKWALMRAYADAEYKSWCP